MDALVMKKGEEVRETYLRSCGVLEDLRLQRALLVLANPQFDHTIGISILFYSLDATSWRDRRNIEVERRREGQKSGAHVVARFLC